MTTTTNFEITTANLSTTRRWMIGGIAAGLFGLGLAVSNPVENLPSPVSAAQAASLETAATPSYQVLTVRAASIDDPVAPQEPLAVSY